MKPLLMNVIVKHLQSHGRLNCHTRLAQVFRAYCSKRRG